MGASAVSVIIPTYNRAQIVARAVTSVLKQCESKDEVIVIDDGSNDDTEQVLKNYRNEIKYHRVSNGGAGYARNIGLEMAKNEFIGFLDSDDEWIPGKLSIQRQLLDARTELSFCFSDLVVVNSEGREQRKINAYYHETGNFGEKILGPGLPLSNIIEVPGEFKNASLHIGNLYSVQMRFICVQVNTTLTRRRVIGDNIRFPEDLTYHEDWEFFSRLSRLGPVAYINCETAKQYFHQLPQLTKTTMINVYYQRIRVLDRVWGEDKEFLEKFEKDFISKKREQQIGLLDELSDKGRFNEVRKVFRNVDQPPIKYRVIYYFPDALLRILFFIYKKFKLVFRKIRSL
jgi:glycosyltransferase involved in cell wall biosynthesis